MKKILFEVLPMQARLKALIVSETDESGRFGWLQKKTGISRNTWQTWWDKEDASPSGKMIEAAARLWPQYAFWLASGITDHEYGHVFPVDLPNSTAWPEDRQARAASAKEYLGHCVLMQDKLAGVANTYNNEKEWERDWERLNTLSWDREINIHSMRVIFGAYEDRIRAQSAKVNPWQPNDDDGIHSDS
ncbi:hypothetical protein [Rugamonas sp. DEMB1]|uniref:hypothetical protein n=1 Tax=Rugamonas sp. DEMB1 TaxID=3039386 RepID=UPI00244BAA3B|nr:hypothetical protein [Rugamonas sp. DEMB1]WGG50329.1 hypothetical protein QC826_28575 [Rugamonas sp. DEMB1]